MFVLPIKADCEDGSTPAICVFSSEITSWGKCQIATCQLVFTHLLCYYGIVYYCSIVQDTQS